VMGSSAPTEFTEDDEQMEGSKEVKLLNAF
jgi:hypothetical protein